MSKGLEALERIKKLTCVWDADNDDFRDVVDIVPNAIKIIEKELKALELIKENLVVAYDENEKDKPCLVLGIKVNKDKMAMIYQTFNREKINLLKEVLL